jgi:uncharacterized protein (DUF342 family)|nr:FapA family protein [Butyrivibrio sp.]
MDKERLPRDLTTEEFYKNYLGAAGQKGEDDPNPADSVDALQDSEEDEQIKAQKALEEVQAIEYEKELSLCEKLGGDLDNIRSKKLDYNQLVEVRKGLESGVDVSRYMNSSMPWMLMEELRLEMEQNIDMTQYRKDGYDLSQIYEIRQGLYNGINTAEYIKKDYLGPQMRQIRLGLEAGLPIVFYKDPLYDAEQMQEIRLGLVDNIDISAYAKFSIPAMKMREARECMKSGLNLTTEEIKNNSAGVLRAMKHAHTSQIDISEYVRQGYDEDQLEQIIIAREEHLDDFDKYLNVEIRGENLREIRIGLKEGLDVSLYADHEFNWHQMREIRKGLENRIDVSVYAKPLYQPRQMHEIRKGLEAGIDVSKYSSMINSAMDMKAIRLRLQRGEDAGIANSISLRLEDDIERRDGHIAEEDSSSSKYKAFDGTEKEKRHFLQMTPDGLKAYLTLPRLKSGRLYTLEFVLELLAKANITFGIKKDVIKDMITNEKYEEKKLIAEGYGPTFGKDGYYEFFFDRKIPTDIEYTQDGSANFDNVRYFATVNVGDKLAVYHPAIHGSDGKTIKNITLPGKNGRDLPLIKGRGFMIMPDHKTFCATVSGAVRFTDGEMIISPLKVVESTRKPLNVDFVGTVWVKGEVPSRSVIRAKGDVIIDGYAEGTTIEADGDIVFRSGCNGLEDMAKISAGGNIYARYLQNLNMTAHKSIFCNGIVNCKADVRGSVMVFGEEGTIIGGDVATQMGVSAARIGSEGDIRTIVRVGVTSELLYNFNENKKAIDRIKAELETLYKEQKRIVTANVNSREQLQWKIKINMAVSTKEKELMSYEEKMTMMTEQMNKVRGASITARSIIYAGVLLIIDGKQLEINTTREEKGGIIYQK